MASCLRLMGNKLEAEDQAQEVFIRVYRGIRNFEGRAKFSTWLFQITANTCRTALKKRGRRLRLKENLLSDPEILFSPASPLEEAAMVFGCTPVQAFRHIVLPLVLPGIAAAAIFTFVMSWNEVFAAIILTIRNRTLPAQVLNTLYQSSEPYQFAGAFFMMIPALIFIFVIRRYLFNMWGQITK